LSFLKKIYKLIDPNTIRGIALGIVISIILVLIFQLDNLVLVLSLLIGVIIVLILGVLLGNYLYTSSKENLERSIDENKLKLNNGLTDLFQTLRSLKNEDEKEFNRIIIESGLVDDLTNILKYGVGIITRFISFGTLISVLGGTVSLAIFMATFMQVQRIDNQNDLLNNQNEKIDIQSYLLESQRRSAFQEELSRVLDLISEERKNFDLVKEAGEQFMISRSLFGRINYLSRSLKPYYYLDIPTNSYRTTTEKIVKPKLIDKPISPERGQLLIALLNADVDLSGGSWSLVDFTYSDLSGSIFDYTINIQGLNIKNSSFVNASIDGITIISSNIEGVDFRHSEIENILLEGNNATGVNFNNATLANVSISQSLLEQASFNNTRFHKSEIHESIMSDTQFDSLKISQDEIYPSKERVLENFDDIIQTNYTLIQYSEKHKNGNAINYWMFVKK